MAQPPTIPNGNVEMNQSINQPIFETPSPAREHLCAQRSAAPTTMLNMPEASTASWEDADSGSTYGSIQPICCAKAGLDGATTRRSQVLLSGIALAVPHRHPS